MKNILLTGKILSTSVSFAGGQNLEITETRVLNYFGDTKAEYFSKQNPQIKSLGEAVSQCRMAAFGVWGIATPKLLLLLVTKEEVNIPNVD